MNFKEYINQSWTDHATDSPKVFKTFPEGEKLISANEEIPQYVQLVTHVCGVHLGDWNSGLNILENLMKHHTFKSGTESENAIKRSSATLRLSSGEIKDLNGFSISDQIRIYAMATTMLADRNEMPRAQQYFSRSLELAANLTKEDPANRALAVTGNNLSCSLEEKKDRNDTDVKLMILAAQTGRKYWEICGGPSEVAMAEYRLSQNYYHLGQIDLAYKHALLSIELCEKNNLSAMDCFYAYETLALVEKVKNNEAGFEMAVQKVKQQFELISANDKKWCEPSLAKLLK